jgi:hypothetical protein
MSENNELKKESETDLVQFLRFVYHHVDWAGIDPKRGSINVYRDNIEVASNESTIPTAFERLHKCLGLQNLDTCEVNISQLIQRLDVDREEVLAALRNEPLYYILLALEGEQ